MVIEIARLTCIAVLVWLFLHYKVEWIKSIRSIITLLVGMTFCYLSIVSKLEAKDFMLIASMVFNFYYLVKERLKAEDEVKMRLQNKQGGA